MPRMALLGGIAAVAIGCTTGELRAGPREAALLVRTGLDCAQGCPNDRPLLVGTQEVADVVGVVELERVLVAVDDPSIATAWIEPLRLCCDDAVACRVMGEADLECTGRESEAPRVVIRALRAGRTSLQLGDDDGELAWEPIEVQDAAEVSVIERVGDRARFDADTIPRDASDGGAVITPWIDGRLDHVEVRAGTTTQLRLVARGSDGRLLMASEGISARIDDGSIAELGSAFGACDGDAMEGEALAIEGVARGSATIEVRAGAASTTFTLGVSAACDDPGSIVLSDDPCETDADCAPIECCHASACGALASAPSCREAVCSLECREGTIDCGGSCLCLEGRCAAYLPSTLDPACEDEGPDLDPVPPLPPPF